MKTLITLTALSLALFAHAQFSIDWSTVDGGGRASTGGVYSVSGTIGQPDAGTASGGSFSLTGGFWSLYAIQTAGAPLLSISVTSTNMARVSWLSPSAGFLLQQNSDLNSTNWVATTNAVTDDGNIKFIIVTRPTGNRFYRLFKP